MGIPALSGVRRVAKWENEIQAHHIAKKLPSPAADQQNVTICT
jgi:hypothetical protein